jgi:hypothetical protein
MKLTDEAKKKITAHLTKVNAELKLARTAVEAGDVKSAMEHIIEAADAKHLGISELPNVPLSPRHDLPFYAIYDLFSDIDHLVSELHHAILVVQGVLSKTSGLLEPGDFLGKLSELIEELMRNFIMKYKNVDSAALDIINELIEALVKIRKLVRDKDFTGVHAFGEDIFDSPRELKLKFLEATGGDIKLDDLYKKFYWLDVDLTLLVKVMERSKTGDEWAAPKADQAKNLMAQIEGLEKLKTELEQMFKT